jgi:E3 ubiquitin-protein ligase HUWE1
MLMAVQRINVLLSVSDLDVLTFALNLLLRPAQQYSAQPSVAHALSISTSRLQALAKRWTFSRDDDVSLVDLTSANSAVQFDTLPPEAREVHFSFYRKGQPVAEAPKAPEEPSVFQTPVRKPSAAGSSVPAPASNGGAVQIDIPSSVLEAKLPMAVFADAVQEHDVPDAERFELLWRIRLASARVPGRGADRVKLAVVRLLAIAIFCHTHTDAQANSALFLFEPDLVAHIAEVLQLDRGVPVAVQTAGLAALDAIARYKPRFPEVLAAVSAGVTHGVLMALLRHTITEIASPDSTTPHAFVEALLQFVTFLASHGSGGSMIVAAGIVPLLIQLLENRVPSRLAVVTRTLSLVDIVLYGYANALQIFMTGHGVDVLVGRVEVSHLDSPFTVSLLIGV